MQNRVYTDEQIAVITANVSGIVAAVERGKNLDVIIVRLTNLIPAIDAAKAEKVLYGEDPEPLENLKQLFLQLIVRAKAMHQRQRLGN